MSEAEDQGVEAVIGEEAKSKAGEAEGGQAEAGDLACAADSTAVNPDAVTERDETAGLNEVSEPEADTAGEEVASEAEEGSPAEDAVQPVAESTEAAGSASDAPPQKMQWYVLRVASNREDQVCEGLTRKVKIEHLEDRIGRILVPTQREKRMRGRVAKVYHRKLYPGYVFIEMETEEDGSVPEDVWFMVKETMSVGDFIGSDGKPTPMKPHDVEKMLAIVERSIEQPTLAGMAGMKKGDPIKVKEGPFEGFEGEIDDVFPDKGQVRVIVTIFGRATPIDLEYWQIELT